MQQAIVDCLVEYDVKYRCIVADFSQKGAQDKMELYRSIERQVENIDIGLIVLNAGVNRLLPLADTPICELQENIDVNAYQVGAMLQKFANRLANRN